VITLSIIAICVICACFPARAGDILLFPEPAGKALSAEAMPYSQTLHAGTENDTFYLRGRFGVDFPIAGYGFDSGGGNHRKILFGINAAAHINMRPTSNMRFPVDNFFAVLALNFAGNINEQWSWRFYPVHHVSAHLADGSKDIKDSVIHAVSSEMARGEIYYKPFGEIVEFGAGAGWYYHVCAQENLRYRADISILFIPPVNILGGAIKPYALLRFENVRQDGDNPGIDAALGVMSFNRNGRRGFGLSARYFNRLHSSYYFEQYEKGWGVEYTFVY